MKIEVKNISYSYNNSSFAVKNASTTINENEFLAIVGHTGSGKSTFIQNLNALLIPTSGSVMVDEVEIKDKIKIKNIKELRKKIGIVFQFPEYQLFEETVEKDILFGPKNFDFKEEDLLHELKVLFGGGSSKGFILRTQNSSASILPLQLLSTNGTPGIK